MDIIQRADLAKQVLENAVFLEAFATLRAAYIDKMVSCGPMDTESLAQRHMAILCLNDVETTLKAYVESGKVEIFNTIKREKI